MNGKFLAIKTKQPWGPILIPRDTHSFDTCLLVYSHTLLALALFLYSHGLWTFVILTCARTLGHLP